MYMVRYLSLSWGSKPFLSNPRKENWAAVKWILKYLCGTYKMCLSIGETRPNLVSYTDADMAGDVDSRKFTLVYLITFIERLCHGSQSYKYVLHFQLPKQSLL